MVILSGKVKSYAQKLEAEYAARRVSGVKIVVEKIEVLPQNVVEIKSLINPFAITSTTEDSIEKNTIENAFRLNWSLNKLRSQLGDNKDSTVSHGVVQSSFQKERRAQFGAWTML